MLQIIIAKGTNGYDISNMWKSLEWSGRKGAAPRCVKITLIDDDGENHARVTVDCEDGDQCVFYEDGAELFRGIIVKNGQENSKKLNITAYDNAYYLANNKDSFSYTNKSASQIFKDCMTRIGMTGGNVADTGYVIPELPKAKTTYYDVMLDALSSTYKATGIRYYIYSDKGNIHLARRSENSLQLVLEVGDKGNIISYSYTKSIEKVKTRMRLLSKENSVVYEKANENLESKIGTFMEIKQVDDSYNVAQMQELVDALFDEKGKPEQSLKIQCIGSSEAISGKAVYVIIPHLGLKRTFYIDEDIHKFDRYSHTMTLKLNYATDIDSAG